jgi:hypothetical protein
MTILANYATCSTSCWAFTTASPPNASFVLMTSGIKLTHCAHQSAAVLLTAR